MIERCLPERPYPYAAPTVAGRITHLQLCRDCRDLLLCLCPTDGGFQAHIGFDPSRTAVLELVASAVESFLHRRGNPEFHRSADERPIESLWRDSDDGVRDIVQALRLADDLAVTFEAIAPKLITDYYKRMGIVTHVLARFETPPENRMNSECVEIVR